MCVWRAGGIFYFYECMQAGVCVFTSYRRYDKRNDEEEGRGTKGEWEGRSEKEREGEGGRDNRVGGKHPLFLELHFLHLMQLLTACYWLWHVKYFKPYVLHSHSLCITGSISTCNCLSVCVLLEFI